MRARLARRPLSTAPVCQFWRSRHRRRPVSTLSQTSPEVPTGRRDRLCVVGISAVECSRRFAFARCCRSRGSWLPLCGVRSFCRSAGPRRAVTIEPLPHGMTGYHQPAGEQQRGGTADYRHLVIGHGIKCVHAGSSPKLRLLCLEDSITGKAVSHAALCSGTVSRTSVQSRYTACLRIPVADAPGSAHAASVSFGCLGMRTSFGRRVWLRVRKSGVFQFNRGCEPNGVNVAECSSRERTCGCSRLCGFPQWGERCGVCGMVLIAGRSLPCRFAGRFLG